jgi:hypothetical protein
MYQSVWIISTWQHISPELTVKGVRKCSISNAVDGTNDGMLWNDSEEDGDVRSECDKDEDIDGDSDSD